MTFENCIKVAPKNDWKCTSKPYISLALPAFCVCVVDKTYLYGFTLAYPVPASEYDLHCKTQHLAVCGCSHFCVCFQPTAEAVRGAIQLGIGYTVGNLTSKPDRDVLMQDFYMVESVFLPRYSYVAHIYITL